MSENAPKESFLSRHGINLILLAILVVMVIAGAPQVLENRETVANCKGAVVEEARFTVLVKKKICLSQPRE